MIRKDGGASMNVALIDDMPRELSRLSGMIAEYASEKRVPVELKAFRSAEELLSGYRPFQYTLLLMDVYMDGMTGVDAAKRIRETDPDTLIVFLTTSAEHTFDAFAVHAYQYILKSPDDAVMKSALFRVMDDIVSLQSAAEGRLALTVDGAALSIAFSGIAFVMSEKNYVHITDRAQNSYRARMTFSEIASLLEADSRFLQINRGIIVNMDCITAFGKDTCELDGRCSLPVNVRDRKKLDQIRKNYVFSKLHGRNKAREAGGQ